MTYFHWITATLPPLIWLWRVVDTALAVRTLTNISRPEWDRNPALPTGNPRVAIIVPARNEEDSIEQALQRLLSLDYANYEVIAINDSSTDRTGQIMDKVASSSEESPRPSSGAGVDARSYTTQLKIVHIRELPPNWMGKAHATGTPARHT